MYSHRQRRCAARVLLAAEARREGELQVEGERPRLRPRRKRPHGRIPEGQELAR